MRVGATTAVLAVAFGAWLADADVEVVVDRTCNTDSIFDTTKLGCYSCDGYFDIDDDRNMQGDSEITGTDGYSLSCTCTDGHRLQESGCTTTFCAASSCISCPANQMPSADRAVCLPCDTATSFFSATTGRCECLDSGHVLIDSDAAGNKRLNITCLPCPADTAVANDPYTCKRCADPNMRVGNNGECQCKSGFDQSGGIYISDEIFCTDASFRTVAGVTFSSRLLLNDLAVDVDSIVQSHYYEWAAGHCYNFRDVTNIQACQTLANLCVMQHYNGDVAPCEVLSELSRNPTVNGASDWQHAVPRIFYEDAASTVRLETDIPLQFAYEEDARSGLEAKVHFYLSSFTLNGEWLGMEELTSQFWYGPNTAPSVVEDEIGNFGFNIEDSFSLNVSALIESGEPSKFYELFLRTSSDEDSVAYYPCPFRDLNHKSQEALPNVNVDVYGAPITGDDVYHQRFMLYDIVGGLEASSPTTPTVIQYADTIILETKVYFEGTQPSIYPPEIAIHYTEIEVDSLQYCDPAEIQLPETVCFDQEVKIQILFYPEDKELWTAVVVIGIFNIMALIALIVFRLMNRNRTNLSESGDSCNMDGTFFKFLIVYLAQAVAWIGAVLPAIFAMYFIVFFKLGPQPFSLLPSLSDFPTTSLVGGDAYLSFKCCVYLSGVFDWIYIAHCIAHQCSVDVFFVDWEKPRGYLRETTSRSTNSRGRKRGSKKPTPVSAWRTIMMANEWCKLGTARKTSIELTLIAFIFVMIGCDFQYIAVPRPNSLSRDEGPKNILLDFGNNVVWFVIIISIQRIGNWMLQRCVVDNPPILFVDLCTIAKVSLMVLDENNRGYYLHCRSPYQFADGSLQDLLKQLAQEEENLTTARGLEDGSGGDGDSKGVSDACQTFEMYITRKFRSNYDTLYKEAMEQHLESVGADEGALSKNLKGARSIRRVKGNMPPEHLQEASTKISEFLRSFFDNSTEHRWKIGARTACGRNCDQGPPPEMVSSKSLLLPDDPITKMCGQRPRFERVLLYGIEAELNLFNIMTFCVIDLASQNKIAAAFGCYLFDLVVVICRAHFGRKNVSTKTLIDEKFLF